MIATMPLARVPLDDLSSPLDRPCAASLHRPQGAADQNVVSYPFSRRELEEPAPDSCITTTTYDLADRRSTLLTPEGETFTYTYDGTGKTTSLVNGQGETTTLAYDPNGRVLHKQLASGLRAFPCFEIGHSGNTSPQRKRVNGSRKRLAFTRLRCGLVLINHLPSQTSRHFYDDLRRRLECGETRAGPFLA